MKRRYTAAAAMLMVMGLCASANAAFDENLKDYTLDTMIVEADAVKNKFGDTITEQSYYRTGGDVKVITREEIEKRHYTDVSEAIKRIPGVVFRNPGYRGGEYGSSMYNNSIAINGDDRVIVLVDGRRVDNAASQRVSDYADSGSSSKSTGVNIDEVTNMENIDKIEVIKGPGASVYGADATGGVINIITRKGGQQNVGSIDLSTGSWDKHKYALSYSGSAGDDKSWHYFVSANRDMSGDTKFKDGAVGREGTLTGARYKEDGVNLRIDKDFNDKQNLKIWYNFKQGKDGYPVTTQKLKYYNPQDWDYTIFRCMVGKLDSNNKLVGNPIWWYPSYYEDYAKQVPGYCNLFQLDGHYGSYNSFKNNDLDITYTFNKENGMDSFVRVYNQNHRYSGSDTYWWGVDDTGSPYSGGEYSSWFHDKYNEMFPDGATAEELKQFMKDYLAPFPEDEAAMNEWIEKTGGLKNEQKWHFEKNKGVQLQVAKSVGVHDIIGSITYDKAKLDNKRIKKDKTVVSTTKRDSITGYLQDKIHVSEKWDITPAIRFSHYKSFSIKNEDGSTTDGKGNSSQITPTLNTQYMFDDTSSMYFGWTRIFRPIRQVDYNSTDYLTGEALKDEKGNAFTLGFKKDLSDKTSASVNYNWTHMSNAIANLPIMWYGSMYNYPINAVEDKKSFNMTVDHQFDDHFTMSASYAHTKNEWKAKDGWHLEDGWPYKDPYNVNTAINSLRPQNHYSMNMSYENGKLYTGLLTNWYTGCSSGFSDRQFLVFDWNLNYEVTKDLNAYIIVNNLTNEGYETSFSSLYGSSSMPGRCIMVGMKYKF